MEQKARLIGSISVITGSITAIISLLALVVNFSLLMYALPLGIVGLILGSIYIYLNTEHKFTTATFTSGLIGVLLSSTPVVMVLGIIIFKHFKVVE